MSCLFIQSLKCIFHIITNGIFSLFDLVVDQEYELQVFPAYAYVGNTAVLKCLIPRFVKNYIEVISWMWGNNVILTNIDSGKRMSS